MNMRLASIFSVSTLSGLLFLALGSNAAADECAQNAKSDPPALSATYTTLPILIWLHNGGGGTERPQISTICFGQNPYVDPNSNHPGDMKVSAGSATLLFRLGGDLQITKWKPLRKSKRRAGARPQPGISMHYFPDGQTPVNPGAADWPDCADDVTSSGSDINFGFSKCLANLGTYQYELHLRQCQNGHCKDIPIDPRIVNQPGL